MREALLAVLAITFVFAVVMAVRAWPIRPRQKVSAEHLVGRRVVVYAMQGRLVFKATGVLEEVDDDWLRFSRLEVGPAFPQVAEDGRIHRGLIARIEPEGEKRS